MAVKFNPFSGSFDLVGDKAISQVLTGYTSGAGTVASTDTILQAIQKLNGNDALKADLAGATFTGNVILSSTTASTSSSTGALQVAGGVGIGGAMNITGTIHSSDGSVSAPSFSFASHSSTGMFYSTSEDALALAFNGVRMVSVNSLDFIVFGNVQSTNAMATGGGGLFVNAGTGSGGIVNAVPQWDGMNGYSLKGNTSTFYGNPFIYMNSSSSVLFKVDVSGAIITNSTTASTSTTTGALQVAGGAGIQGKVFIGGDVSILEGVNTGVPLAIRGFGTGGSYTQTGDLQKWQSYNGTTATDLIRIDSSGALAGANISGTNAIGGILNLKAGAGTGTGVISTNVSSTVDFYTPIIGTSGAVAQTMRKCLSVGYVEASTAGSALWLTSGSPTQSNYQIMGTSTGAVLIQATSGQPLQFKDTAGSNIYLTLNANTLHVGNSQSSVYRTSNGGSNITARFMADPANSVATAGSLAYGFDLTNGLIFTHANGTLRIMGWGVKLTNLINTAGSESSDLTWTPQNVIDKFIIGGGFQLNQLTGTSSRMVEVDASGNISASSDIMAMVISDATIITQLTTGGNWTGVNYTGSAITGATQGQFYYNGTYYYLFVDNTTPIRMSRS